MSKKEMIAIVCACVAVLTIVIAVGVAARSDESKFDTTDYYIKTVKVEKGDTLWEFGEIYKNNEDNIRDWIKEVKELNGMKSSGLIAGDYIKVYVSKY